MAARSTLEKKLARALTLSPTDTAEPALDLLLHRIEDRCNRAVNVLRAVLADDGTGARSDIVAAALERVTQDLNAISEAARAARCRPHELAATVDELRRQLGEEVS